MKEHIERLSLELLNAYASNNTEQIKHYELMLFTTIYISEDWEDIDEVGHNYLASKALLYVINEDMRSLYDALFPKVVAVTFYFLLKCIQQEEQTPNSGIKSDHDFAVSSALAFILMAENSKIIQEKILLPILENDIDTTLRLYFSLLGTFYWDYKTTSVIESFDENVRVRLKAAIENNYGLRDIAERTKVLMKQMVHKYMDVLIDNYSTKVFKNFV